MGTDRKPLILQGKNGFLQESAINLQIVFPEATQKLEQCSKYFDWILFLFFNYTLYKITFKSEKRTFSVMK